MRTVADSPTFWRTVSGSRSIPLRRGGRISPAGYANLPRDRIAVAPTLANATLQQRLVAVRLFYDYLVEEGLRDLNPVGRGRYTAGKSFGGHRERGLLPRFRTLPWIPTDEQWRELLAVARSEPIRNRLMLALAYDAGLRREELCLVRSDDFDPAHRTVRIRAETTKGGRERIVPYSASTGALLRAYLGHRRALARSSCRNPTRTRLSRLHHGHGRRWSGHLPCERICRVSARIRCATSA
jgi:integrase/recombinase XerD